MKTVIHSLKVLNFEELTEAAQMEAMREQMKGMLQSNSLNEFMQMLSEYGKNKLTELCSWQGDTEDTQRKFYPDGTPFTYSDRGNYLITKI